MAGGNCRPDSGVYNAVVGTLWSTGILAAQAKAVAVFKSAVHAGHFRLSVHTSPDASVQLVGTADPCLCGSLSPCAGKQCKACRIPQHLRIIAYTSLFRHVRCAQATL